MKRVFVLISVLVLVFTLMVVPAFALESYSMRTTYTDGIYSHDLNFEEMIPEGEYNISIVSVSPINFTYTFENVVFSYTYEDYSEDPFIEPGFPGYVIGYYDLSWQRPDWSNEFGCDFFIDWLVTTEGLFFVDAGCGACYEDVPSTDVTFTFTPVAKEISGSELFLQSIEECLLAVIAWVSLLVSAFVSPQGALNGLLPLFVVVIAVPALFFGIKAIHRFIWGA